MIQHDLDYFRRGPAENERFWVRLGGRPAFKGLSVLDVGCGHGSLCVDAAEHGATRVVGIDTDQQRIAFADENATQQFPHLRSALHFLDKDLRDCEERNFDVILSKDSFEHILDPDAVLAEMSQRLKPGGRIYIGFAPLYNSPIGHHFRTGTMLPWGHLLTSEQKIVAHLNRKKQMAISSIRDLGLNMYALRDYRRIFTTCGLQIETLLTNQSRNPGMKLFSLIANSIKPLEEYFTHNLYCILRKSS
jgi:SAM-dependent methyltransferase